MDFAMERSDEHFCSRIIIVILNQAVTEYCWVKSLTSIKAKGPL